MNDDETLRDLTARLRNLSQAEWTRLYRLVFRVLRSRNWSEIQGLPGALDEYIQDFIGDKLVRLDGPNRTLYHTGALGSYFKRYLVDRLRDPYVKYTTSISSPGGEDDETPESDRVDAALARAHEARGAAGACDDEDLRDLIDLLGEAAAPTPRGHRVASALYPVLASEFGIEVPVIRESAHAFLRAHADWGRIYLREHFCAEDGLALSALRVKYGLGASYHYQAVRLGISVPKKGGGAAAMASFRRSDLGQWLASLGIPMDDDHRVEMVMALKILCLAALEDQPADQDP